MTYTYDAGANGKGRRTGMTDASGSTAWTYDARGRMLTETKVISGASFTTAWTYNPADLPLTMTYPDGETLTYTYNSRMLLESVTGTDTYVSSILYDSAGRITRLTRGAGTLDTTYTYYPWTQQGGRLQNLTTASLQNLTYTYDPVGNITQIADSLAGETHLYTYDALDRLTAWTLNGVTETYTYNPATGNLENKAGMTLQYDDAAHIHAVTSAGGNAYSYDPNGNQTTRVIGADTFTLIYDAENRLIEVKKDGTTIAQFTYDGDGKRVKSVLTTNLGSTAAYFIGNYYEVTNGVVTKYYYAGGQRIALRQDGALYYLLSDHLGSTALVTDASGNIVSELRYKAWGETRYNSGSTPTRYQYTGQYSYTADFGLYFYNARWYDPTLGRFAQPDSLIPEQSQGAQAWDRYAYVNNNPLRYNDPSGHCPWCIAVGIGALVGAGIGYGIQVYHNYQNGLSGAAAWTQNISAEPIINGAFIGAGAVIGAYVVTQAAVALLPAATTAGTLVCADGDCTNEVTAGVNAVNNAANAACADGDCTNEVTAIVPYYPPNGGFAGEPESITLQPGTILDRYGSTAGSYLSPAGTPPWQRSLPPGVEKLKLNTYEVVKPIENVLTDKVAPWFGQPGGGIQYYLGLGRTVQRLLDEGYLRLIER